MQKYITLELIDISSKEDQHFLYSIVEFRWKHKEIINIKHKTPETKPTFEEHINNLKSDKYKAIYKIKLLNNLIGSIYIDKNNFNGTFLLPNLIKKCFKDLKQKNIEIDKTLITPQIHMELFKKHKEVNLHYASVNPNNQLSLKALIDNGYEPVELVLVMTTDKTGKGTIGKWANKYE